MNPKEYSKNKNKKSIYFSIISEQTAIKESLLE